MSPITVVMAQINPLVGDIDGNTQQIIESVLLSQERFQADIVVFPELTLCGYPPEDLLLRHSMSLRIENALKQLQAHDFSAVVVVGYPQTINGQQYNMAGVLQHQQWIAEYAKQHLPNYQVFDEKRYFTEGGQACVFMLGDIPVALTICEDIWHDTPVLQARDAGARLMINLNASPFHREKQQQRHELLSMRALQGSMPIVYVNQVGGQDELVFDGASFAVDAQGQCAAQAPLYQAGLYPVTWHWNGDSVLPVLPSDQPSPSFLEPEPLSVIYQALVLGLQDYVRKNRFKGVVLGLSGGIDSALTLAIAVDALGAENVQAVMMPFRYTSEMSQNDAAEQAKRLQVRYSSVSIETMYTTFMESLKDEFANLPVDLAEQNLQARCRGVLLMAISNKKGTLVLTTGNKSELAVGYSTLYGDMAGGFDVLKDVPKTLVFDLARYCNREHEIIPASVIERPPSAELAPDQKDEDNLPPYDILDNILECYVEADQSAQMIIEQGFDAETVYRVIRLVDMNEYKRRQAPVGIRISAKGFGRDRRYPITNGWLAGE